MKGIYKRCLLLVVCLCCSVGAYAYDFVTNGIYYRKASEDAVEVTYKQLRRNVLTYSGNVVIPETVKDSQGKLYKVMGISEYAFEACQGLTSVTIPTSVTSIGDYAFCFCMSLTSVVIPDSVKELGQCAFTGCNALKSVKLSSGIKELKMNLFWACPVLTSVQMPKSLVKIGFGAFGECTSLTSIEIPAGVTEMEQVAFRGCTALASVVIPESLTSIPRDAFSGCTSLKKLTLPNTLKSIGPNAFSNCGLETVFLPESATSIDPSAFDGCQNLKKVVRQNDTSHSSANGHDWVDMGLPSGTKWATCNIGASRPEFPGYYYAWSDIAPKPIYDPMATDYTGRLTGNPYEAKDTRRFSKPIGGKPNLDAARANWGGEWRMPTKEEFEELGKNCRVVEVTINGWPCLKVTSLINFNELIFPLMYEHRGIGVFSIVQERDVYATSSYWTSTPDPGHAVKAYYYNVSRRSCKTTFAGIGMCVRPVITVK